MSEKENKMHEKLEPLLVIDELEKLKDLISLVKKRKFYFKGMLHGDLHSALYNDYKKKNLNKSFQVNDLVFLSREILSTTKNKKELDLHNNLEIMINMEKNNVATLLIEFSDNLLYEIWLAASEITNANQLSFDYFSLFILMEPVKIKENVRHWHEKNIYKSSGHDLLQRKDDSFFIIENDNDLMSFYDIKEIRINTHLKEEILKYLYSKKVNAENVFKKEIVPYKEVTTYGPLKLNIEGIESNFNGEYEKAIKKYEEIVKISPKHKGIYGNWGMVYLNMKEYKMAIKKFKKSLNKEEKTEIYNSWGQALCGLNKYKKAIGKFKKSIKKGVDESEAYNYWGLALNGMNKYKKAIKKFESSIKIKGNFAEAHNNCGMAYTGIRKYKKAVEEFKEAIKLDPSYEEAEFNLEFAESKLSSKK